MPAYDISARIRGWVGDALSTASMGQEFGYDVRFDSGRPIPNGPINITYHVIVTLRHPLLGQPPLAAEFPIPVNLLGDESLIRRTAQSAALQLGKLYADQLRGLKDGGPVKMVVPPQGQVEGN